MQMTTAGAKKTKANGAATVRQQTLKTSIHCAGVALHSGAKVSMTLMPAPVDSGIVFRRADLGADARIRASWDRVVDTRLCTVLGENGATVGTVEHLLAALSGCGIDNAVVELDGPEVPIMDGSAAPFVFLVECAGIVEQDAPRRVIRVLKPVAVEHGQAKASLSPGKYLSMNFEIDFDNPAVSNQRIKLGLVNGTFRSEVARARTFGFLHEVEKMRAAGLALGGSLDNAIVIAGDKILNEDGLRFRDEFVRHKVLDAVGDLYLAGAPIIGEFTGVCSGHAVNNRLLRALFANDAAWRYDTMTQKEADSVAAAHHGVLASAGAETLAASA